MFQEFRKKEAWKKLITLLKIRTYVNYIIKIYLHLFCIVPVYLVFLTLLPSGLIDNLIFYLWQPVPFVIDDGEDKVSL
jgi:hypothetical protein